MREEEKRYETEHDTEAPLYVMGIPTDNLLDRVASWSEDDDVATQQNEDEQVVQQSEDLPRKNQRKMLGDSQGVRVLRPIDIPQDNSSFRVVPLPDYFQGNNQREMVDNPQGMRALRRRNIYGDEYIPVAPYPTDNLRVEQQPTEPITSYIRQGMGRGETVPPTLSADDMQRLRPSSRLMSYLSKRYPEQEAAPATLPTDNLRVEQQPVLPPDVVAKGPHVGLGMDHATSVIDGLRVALERTRLSWDYIEAQARRFINGEQQRGKEYERALQRVTEAGIDSDEKLQSQLDALSKSSRISDKEDALALMSVQKLRNEGIEWNELPNVLREMSQVPGEASRDLESISRQYAELPDTEGAAAIADIGANIVGGALPVALAIALTPKAAAVAGAGVVVTDIATTIADAQMRVDAYEHDTGKKVSGVQRGMYVTAATATNVLMDVLLNSSVFGKLLPNKVADIADKLMIEIMSSPVAQAEFNAMTRQVLQNEARAYAKQVTGAAVSGSMTSGALEAEQSIYTGKFPELQRVVNSTVEGFIMGGVAGSALAGAQAYDTHRKRYEADNIYYVSRTEGPYEGRFPMREVRDIEYQNDGIMEGTIYSPNSGTKRQIIPVENIVSGSYREAVEGKSFKDLMHDNYVIPDKQLNYYRERWEKLRKSNTHEAAMEQNEILQDVAASMGVPIKVYEHYEDLPSHVKADEESINAVGLTVGKRDIYLVLPMCNYLTFDGVLSTIRHELVGHRGLHRLYESKWEYNDELDRVGPTVVREQNIEKRKENPDWKDVRYRPTPDARAAMEESFSRTAEKRRYDKGRHSGSEGLKDPTLRKSDRNMRNATINEQRAGIQLPDGNPMPTILEIEEQRKRERKRQK